MTTEGEFVYPGGPIPRKDPTGLYKYDDKVTVREVIDVNFMGPAQTNAYIIPLLSKTGKIITIGSGYGILSK